MTWILGRLGVPQVHAPPPSFHKMLNILETVQIPTFKPYILLFLMMRRSKWHGPWIPKGSPGGMPHPLHFIKCVISRKLFRSPPINHIYCCSLWQAAFSDMDPRVPPGHAPPALFIKCIISPPINHIYSCFDLVWPFEKFSILTLSARFLKNCLSYCLETWQADREWWVNDLINLQQLTQVSIVAHGPLVYSLSFSEIPYFMYTVQALVKCLRFFSQRLLQFLISGSLVSDIRTFTCATKHNTKEKRMKKRIARKNFLSFILSFIQHTLYRDRKLIGPGL